MRPHIGEAALAYRHQAKSLTREQRAKIKEILREEPNLTLAHDWIIGAVSVEELQHIDPAEYKPSTDETHSLQRELALLGNIKSFIEDPEAVHPEKHAQLLRHLAFQLEQNMPTLVAESVKPGESIVSISFNGVKSLNANGAGIHVTNQILQQFRQEIEIAFRQHGLIDITVLPTQQLWKRLSFRVPDIPTDELVAKVNLIEQSVTQRVKDFIDMLPEESINPEAKEATKATISITHGITRADRESKAFNVLQESVIQAEIGVWEHDLNLHKQDILTGIHSLPATTGLIKILKQDLPDTPEERAEYAFATAEEIREIITQQLHVSNATNLLSNTLPRQGFSNEFFQILRQGDKESLQQALPHLNTEQLDALYDLGKLYTQTLFSPTVLKEFTLDESTSHIRKARLLNQSAEEIFRLALKGTVDLGSNDREFLKEAWDHLQRDPRFTGPDLKGPFLNPLFFDGEALSSKSPHYISLDLIGVGATFLEDAQQIQHLIAQKGNSYNAIMEQTRTLGETSWRRIHATFSTIADILKTLPELQEFFERTGGMIPASTKGDEMVIAIPGDIDKQIILTALRDAQSRLSLHQEASPVRLALASATRIDDEGQTEQQKIAAHIETRILSEKYGIDIAKIFEPYFPGSIAEVQYTNTTSRTVQFRLHFPGTSTTDEWHDIALLQTAIDREELIRSYQQTQIED